jgi:type III restriction enzyme
MDELHRYRADAAVRVINELKPILGLELTATPFEETNRGPAKFKNVVLDCPLGRTMADGFVKEPAIVTPKTSIRLACHPRRSNASSWKTVYVCTKA